MTTPTVLRLLIACIGASLIVISSGAALYKLCTARQARSLNDQIDKSMYTLAAGLGIFFVVSTAAVVCWRLYVDTSDASFEERCGDVLQSMYRILLMMAGAIGGYLLVGSSSLAIWMVLDWYWGREEKHLEL